MGKVDDVKISRIQQKTEEIMQGGREAVLTGLENDGAHFRAVAVLSAVKHKFSYDADIENGIRRLTNDNTRILNCPISSIAYAALDILDIEKYKGIDETIKKMIRSGLDI